MSQKKPIRVKKAASSAASKKASAKKSAGSKASAKKRQKKSAAKTTQKSAKKPPPLKKAASKATASKKTQGKEKPVSKAAVAPKSSPKKAFESVDTTKEASRRGQPKPEEQPPAPKPAKVSSKYGVGDKVVHPQHGAATIAKRVKREFGGVVRDYYVLDISTESLTVMVPIDKIDFVVRSVISKAQSRHVLNSLKDEAQEAGANWSRWYKVLTEKMYSGDIFQVAEVVRDLSYAQQTKGISPALKRMLSKARMTLISELSFSFEVDEEEATRRLDKAVPKVETALVPVL